MLKRFVIVFLLVLAGCASIQEANQQGRTADLERDVRRRTNDDGYAVFNIQRATFPPQTVPTEKVEPRLEDVKVLFGDHYMKIEKKGSLITIPYSSIEQYERKQVLGEAGIGDALSGGLIGLVLAPRIGRTEWIIIWRKTGTGTEKIYLDAGSTIDTIDQILKHHTRSNP